MELKFVVPNMEKTFGNLEFAGENNVTRQRANNRSTKRNYGYARNRRYRSFTLPLCQKDTTSYKALEVYRKKERPVRNTNRSYFSFKISFGVQSRNSQSLAKMARSILETLFLQ